MNSVIRLTAALSLTALAATLVWAHSSNPPIGVTGAPGEATCAVAGCHDQFPLNSGPGAADLPPWLFWTYPIGTCPDETTAIAIMVRQSGAARWGFELTVVTEAGASSGTMFLTNPGRTALVQGVRNYVFHTEAGTDAGSADSSPGWTANWVFDGAPFTSPIRAYVAGVAADNDGTPQGDYVYTDSADIAIFIADIFCFLPGDLNQSSTITSADILYLVNFVFRSGPPPPDFDMMGDLNCDGIVASADIIRLVNYVFKGGWPPCDPCAACCLHDDLTWTCP